MIVAQGWRDYQVLDTGEGEKLERWGEVVLRRPDPQVIWPAARPEMWSGAHARYQRSDTGGGSWHFAKNIPDSWSVSYDELSFIVRPTGFKHTGLFPEQAANWDFMSGLISGAGRPVRVLNLFGYTGGASIACAAAGAEVTHVDAAKGMVEWAKENMAASALQDRPVRYLVDDAVKFVQREERRGRAYEGIVMDPPSYGRGPDGQVWKLETAIYPLLCAAAQLLSEQPLFFLVNAYTTGLQPAVLSMLLRRTVCLRRPGQVYADELGLPIASGGVLPCGAVGRWVAGA